MKQDTTDAQEVARSETSAASTEPVDVLLVSMPFGPHILHPSIGLSLLKASLLPLGISCKILYLTFQLAQRIGDEMYREISYSEPSTSGFAGEWLFCQELFPEIEHDVDGYVDDILRAKSPAFGAARRLEKQLNEVQINKILSVRPHVAGFMDDAVQEVLSHRPRIVGFTSTFQQHVASLALARRLKAVKPDLFTMIGGANCEGIMGWETLHRFPCIDVVTSGEGDDVFPKLVQEVLAGGEPGEHQGVFTRTPKRSRGLRTVSVVEQLTAPPIHDMDALPYPDYEDFFAQFHAAGLELAGLSDDLKRPRLMFETSRGCWWGAKSHCTFCGLNGGTMAFRAKSAERAFKELSDLLTQYPGCKVSVVDNILDMKYFKDFVPRLAEAGLDAELFYEVKANLSKKQLVMMRDAGILQIQPGIESFSSHVLSLMRKGVTGIQNVQVLKWCKELGITAFWNLLWGFPGETAEDYEEVNQLLPLISHLAPPVGYGVIRLDRFSPNFNEAEQMGFVDVRPYPAYDYVYRPLPEEARRNMAYFFTYNFRDPRSLEDHLQPLRDQLKEWPQVFEESDLFSVDKGDRLLVWDLRPVARQSLTVLNGTAKKLFEACDGICGLHKLQAIAEADAGKSVSQEQLAAALQPLVDCGLLLREGSSYLSLAIPLGDYSPPGKVLRKFQRVVQTLGRAEGDRIMIDPDQPEQREVVPA